MATAIVDSDVEAWLDEEHPVIDTVEQIHGTEAEYHFAVRTDNLLINVVKRDAQGPLILGAEASLMEDHISAVREAQDEIFPKIESVLTTGPGVYAFTDGDGNPVDIDEVRAVMVRHWIYPDGASQHAIMTAIVDIVSSLLFVQGSINHLLSD